MTIVFRPRQGDFGNECGSFELKPAACMQYLQRQVEWYSIALDSLLLDWIKQSAPGETVPARFQERARYLVSELCREEGACTVVCETCHEQVPSRDVLRREWDESVDVQGVRVGAAGYTMVCPRGHDLIHICTTAY